MIIVNLIFVIVLQAGRTFFHIFGFGACPIGHAPVIASLSIYVFLPLMVIGFPVLLITDAIKAFKYRKTYKWKVLLPLPILLIGVFLPLPFHGVKLAEERFLARFDKYQLFVDKLELSDIHTNSEWIDDTESFKGLAYRVLAYENEPNEFVVEFLVGGMGPPPKHTAFLYTSSGEIKRNSKADERWYSQKRMNENWFKVHD